MKINVFIIYKDDDHLISVQSVFQFIIHHTGADGARLASSGKSI